MLKAYLCTISFSSNLVTFRYLLFSNAPTIVNFLKQFAELTACSDIVMAIESTFERVIRVSDLIFRNINHTRTILSKKMLTVKS